MGAAMMLSGITQIHPLNSQNSSDKSSLGNIMILIGSKPLLTLKINAIQLININGNKPLPEAMFSKLYDAIWCH